VKLHALDYPGIINILFSIFVKEDSEYTTQWLVKRGQIQHCQSGLFHNPIDIDYPQNRFKQKIPGRHTTKRTFLSTTSRHL